jgi:hypothetical protein
MSKKQTISILVIDDDRDRDIIYKQFFSKLSNHANAAYEITAIIPDSPAEVIRCLLAKEPCFVVLDMRFTGEWEIATQSIYEAIRKLGCPISLLSMDFNDPVVSLQASNVLSQLKNIPKLGFLPFGSAIRRHCYDSNLKPINAELPSDQVSIWNLMLAESLEIKVNWKPKLTNEITFLHLTDTHFGKSQPDYLNAVAILNGSTKSDSEIGPLLADYLIWTGDITDKGLPSEFALASSFAADLFDTGVLPASCPISLVPGNHDLCRPLALSSRMNLEKSIDKKTSAASMKWIINEDLIAEELWEFGAQPYKELDIDG